MFYTFTVRALRIRASVQNPKQYSKYNVEYFSSIIGMNKLNLKKNVLKEMLRNKRNNVNSDF